MDEDDDGGIGGQYDDLDMRQGDNEFDNSDMKPAKRSEKRKLKDTNKSFTNEPIPSKLYKQMQILLDFVIKYRDK